MADKTTGTSKTNLVAVDIGRLGESLQTVFSGIAGMFGALGLPAADVPGNVDITVTGSEEKRTSKVRKADSETAEIGKGKKGNGAGDEDRSEDRSEDGQAGKETDGKPEGADVGVLDADHAGVAGDADTGSDRQVTGPAEDPEANTEGDPAAGRADGKSSVVTADDITKVIVAKIKQDRSNSQKIRTILKTYGAEKVSALKPEQYEAFLTDISQI